jgi:dihydropteroate synthase
MRPHIFGIVNITEDSFSDGGLYLDPDAAVNHALRLVAEGADVVDLGPASTHPDAKEVKSEEEISVFGASKRGVARETRFLFFRQTLPFR